MKLSTKGRYGARAALELALRYGDGPVMVREIAESQEISERYLEHILNALRASGIVRSTRGARGGYELAKSPAAVTLGDIVRALEGPLDIVSCTRDEDCNRTSVCVTMEIWLEVREAIEGVLDSVTLEDMARRHRTMNVSAVPDYII
ncbi:MAG: RrF2 family transcriptional regulator [Candidatus Latescibacterota bacterium]